MPAFPEQAAAPAPAERQFDVLKQDVTLEIDFASRTIRGDTNLILQPRAKDIRSIRLHCRQARITDAQVKGYPATWQHEDPYKRLRVPPKSTVHQYEMLRGKIAGAVGGALEPELELFVHKKFAVEELQVDASAVPQYNGVPGMQRQTSDGVALAEMPALAAAKDLGPRYAPFKVHLDFELDVFRDGIHWVGFEDGDRRYPYLYTNNAFAPGNTSCIFPCLDDLTARCMWEVKIKVPRTLGDAFRKPRAPQPLSTGASEAMQLDGHAQNPSTGESNGSNADEYLIDLGEEERALELTVLCSGELGDDREDPEDETQHTLVFNCEQTVTARHVCFAIGPFEHFNLSTLREVDEEDKLGQSAVKINCYCLPGRLNELRNTCFPVTQAIDFFSVTYGSFPFPSHKMCFVDDMVGDTADSAGLTLCSSRLLFPEDIIEPLDRNTRILVNALASQWVGVNVIQKELRDAWAIIGISHFMTDIFMKKLAGNNEYRFRQKMAVDEVQHFDSERPSIHQLGELLHIDPSIPAWVALKAPLVLFILDRRLLKASSAVGVTRIINKILLNAKTGTMENGELSTADFQRICDKLGHTKLDAFFRQWVYGAGAPIFKVTQKFNKKKFVVELDIWQLQTERNATKPPFVAQNFLREAKEHVGEVWAPEVQPLFTGPMTIRIHEADGTPHEHIVEIKEAKQHFDIPHSTKYKRLRRNKRQKERTGAGGIEVADNDDALLYSLGDVLQTPEEIAEWKLADWRPEDVTRMEGESYEWIRLDADFEWIAKFITHMEPWMWVSQLQQDKDVVAQAESLQALVERHHPHPLQATFLTRTLMDRRYFHGIRIMAAEQLWRTATERAGNIGQDHLIKAFQHMFCYEGSSMPRSNYFSDRTTLIIQSAIPEGLALVRDADGRVPMAVRQFFLEKLRFNDNSSNDFSDCHYVATLMRCLTEALVATAKANSKPKYSFNFDEEEEEEETPDERFQREAINEIERYRRIDEWISSYHNIYSTTALDCLARLTKVGAVKEKEREVLQYTLAGNSDLVRLQAFTCLADTGLTRKMSVMKYLLHVLANDPSPFFRHRLMRIFGLALGHIAIGDEELEGGAPAAPPPTDGLILEPDVPSQQRHLNNVRKTTADGALAALLLVLQNEEPFKHALWYAATAPGITIAELSTFLQVAQWLYKAIRSLVLTLNYPRAPLVKYLGGGKMRFNPERPLRTQPREPLSLDDWKLLGIEAQRLHYDGPLSAEVQRYKDGPSQSQSQSSLKLKLQTALPAIAPFGDMMPPPVLPTPTSGLKLNLKRKQSTTEAPPREGSPKPAKSSRQQTPSAAAASVTAGKAKRSPSVVKQRRSSTPASQASPKPPAAQKLVKLRISAANAPRVQDALANPVSERSSSLTSANLASQRDSAARSSTPVLPQMPSDSPYLGQNLLASPTGSSAGSFRSFSAFRQQPLQPPPPPPLNLGGFRSFGAPAADAFAAVSVAELKQEAGSPANGTALSASPTGPAPFQAPPVLNGEAALQPPKKKFTLKLGRANSGGQM